MTQTPTPLVSALEFHQAHNKTPFADYNSEATIARLTALATHHPEALQHLKAVITDPDFDGNTPLTVLTNASNLRVHAKGFSQPPCWKNFLKNGNSGNMPQP